MEIYKDLSNPASKEFEKLLNSKLSKANIEEGKIIDGKINKITDKFVFLFAPALGLICDGFTLSTSSPSSNLI